MIGHVTWARYFFASLVRNVLVSIDTPVGIVRMKASMSRGDGSSITSPFFMPAMSTGHGFTSWGRGSSNFSFQVFRVIGKSPSGFQRKADVGQQLRRRVLARTVEILFETGRIVGLVARLREPSAEQPFVGGTHRDVGSLVTQHRVAA